MNASPITAQAVEAAAHALRVRLDAAAEVLAAYEADTAPVRDRYAPQIRRHAAEVRAERERLLGLLGAAPRTLWGKVKSRVVHGLTIGWRKAADAWAWPTDDDLVALIKARCTPEQQAAYLVTTTRGRKDAIPEAVRAQTLGLGCTRGQDAPLVSETAPSTGEALFALLAALPGGDDAKPAKAGRAARARQEAA